MNQSQTTLFATIGGFDILPHGEGFKIRDTDTFNNWGEMRTVFTTSAEATAYAWRCYEFKTGRRMSVD